MTLKLQSKKYKEIWIDGEVSDIDIKRCLYDFNEGARLVKVYQNEKFKYWSWENLKRRSDVLKICEEKYPEYMI